MNAGACAPGSTRVRTLEHAHISAALASYYGDTTHLAARLLLPIIRRYRFQLVGGPVFRHLRSGADLAVVHDRVDLVLETTPPARLGFVDAVSGERNVPGSCGLSQPMKAGSLSILKRAEVGISLPLQPVGTVGFDLLQSSRIDVAVLGDETALVQVIAHSGLGPMALRVLVDPAVVVEGIGVSQRSDGGGNGAVLLLGQGANLLLRQPLGATRKGGSCDQIRA